MHFLGLPRGLLIDGTNSSLTIQSNTQVDVLAEEKRLKLQSGCFYHIIETRINDDVKRIGLIIISSLFTSNNHRFTVYIQEK